METHINENFNLKKIVKIFSCNSCLQLLFVPFSEAPLIGKQTAEWKIIFLAVVESCD